jgi:hypothetical protein
MRRWWPDGSQFARFKPSVALASYFAKLLLGILAPAETFHFAVRISRGATTGRFGTLHLAQIVDRAIAHAAHDVPILIPHRTASFFGTQHLAVLIRCALPFPAHYVSILVLDAIPGIGLGGGRQGHEASNEQSMVHGASFAS